VRSPALAGIFSLAWKIFRGAELASTKMVTVGGVADQLGREKEKIKTKIKPTTLKMLESFMLGAPIVFDENESHRERNLRL